MILSIHSVYAHNIHLSLSDVKKNIQERYHHLLESNTDYM